MLLNYTREIHAPAIHGALAARCFMFNEVARIDRKYVVFPDIEYTNRKGDSPSHLVSRFLTARRRH